MNIFYSSFSHSSSSAFVFFAFSMVFVFYINGLDPAIAGRGILRSIRSRRASKGARERGDEAGALGVSFCSDLGMNHCWRPGASLAPAMGDRGMVRHGFFWALNEEEFAWQRRRR
ncbi:hypothetical protein NL676_038041 [Syzygium grande]|nr:hypothetical protein NL676_038041 [Syzygium grande]